jgi:phosphatidylserine/phosphatidylglycerophosphate/cardiolipin synthase-like enzyme
MKMNFSIIGSNWHILFLLLLALTINSSLQYANQTVTYVSHFEPLVRDYGTEGVTNSGLNIGAFFSPDFSAPTLTALVENAKSEVLIAIPGFSSWIGCTSSGTSCYGCDASKLKFEEKFPVFQALINAIHRGVTVKVLTNDPAQYGDKQCTGKMSLLTYLAIAGAQVRYYTSTAYLHSKFMSIDYGAIVSISSINYSKTSIMMNREAGVLIYNNADVANFTRAVFDFDFQLGVPMNVPYSEYSQEDIDLIRDKEPIPVIVPENYHFKFCKTESPSPKPVHFIKDATMTLIASPDFAYENMIKIVKKAKKSLQLSIYELSSPDLCDLLLELNERGVELKIFASNEVVGEIEKRDSHICYNRLYNNNIAVKLSHPHCLHYSHQKYWIIDNEIIVLSTGNWASTDYPKPPNVFPPTNAPGFRRVNRDFTIAVSSTSGNNPLLDAFQTVFDEDYSQGTTYEPSQYYY